MLLTVAAAPWTVTNAEIHNPPSFSWARAFGGTGYQSVGSVHQTLDGGFIVVGYSTSFGAGSSDAWILKLDRFGSVQWQKAYGGPGADDLGPILQTSDGGFIALGSTELPGGSHAWLVKLDSQGNIVWEKAYGVPLGSADGIDGTSLDQTADGGYIFAGDVVFRLDASGNIMWQKVYGFLVRAVRQTLDGSFVMVGDPVSFGVGGTDALVVKIDSAGSVVWQKAYGGPDDDHAYSLELASDGGYVVAGSSRSFSGGVMDGWVFKLDLSGNVVWQKAYGGRTTGSFSEIYSMTLASDGGLVLAGYTSAFGAGLNDGWILRLDSSGNVLWQRTFGGSQYDALGSVEQTSDGGYVVGGYTENQRTSTAFNAWVLKLDPQGNIPQCRNEGVPTPVVTDTVANVTAASLTARITNEVIIRNNSTVTLTNGHGMLQCLSPDN